MNNNENEKCKHNLNTFVELVNSRTSGASFSFYSRLYPFCVDKAENDLSELGDFDGFWIYVNCYWYDCRHRFRESWVFPPVGSSPSRSRWLSALLIFYSGWELWIKCLISISLTCLDSRLRYQSRSPVVCSKMNLRPEQQDVGWGSG